MNYFVSVENTPYQKWQIDLLYESFKDHGLEDQLVIAACPLEYVPELELPGNIFEHENVGHKVGYPPLNKPYSLYHALKEGVVQLPVTVIDPDMIMVRPVEESSLAITGQHVWYMNYDRLKEDYQYEIKEWFGIEEEEWKPIGCVYQFSPEVSLDFFKEVYMWCCQLVEKFPEGDGQLSETAYWTREMMAFAIPISLSGYKVGLVNDYEMPLDRRIYQELNDPNSCFMHYCNGIPGKFYKRSHNALREVALGDPLPYETIMSIPSFRNKRLSLMKKYCKICWNELDKQD